MNKNRIELADQADGWFKEDKENRSIIFLASELEGDDTKVAASVGGTTKELAKSLLDAMRKSQQFAEAVRIALYNFDDENILKAD